MKIFELPDLGEGLPDAIIREWYVKAGDEVLVDQPIVAMETAKALVDVPSPYAGIIVKLHGDVGETINTHHPLVSFNDQACETERKDSGTVVGDIQESGKVLQRDTMSKKTSNTRIKATPAIRLLAKKLGVDLNTLRATNGTYLTADDVRKAAEQNKSTQQSSRVIQGRPLSGIRQAMVSNMVQSHNDIVPVTLSDDADIHTWYQQDVTIRLLRALTYAIQKEPILNSHFHADSMSIETFNAVHVSMAVDTEEGLFVPVIKDVASRSNLALRESINRYKQQAQNKSIPQSDLQGGTIMLSNFGAFAGQYANPIILPPMVAILGVGRSRKRVVPSDGEMAIHNIMPLSLTVDHRVVTGGEAARFLKAVIESLAQSSSEK